MGKQHLDAGPTATKTPRKQYTRNTSANWDKIRQAWQAGESPTNIARIHRISTDAIYKRSQRDGWPPRPTPQPLEPVAVSPEKPIASAIKARLGDHFTTVLHTVNILQRGISDHAMRRLEVEEIKTLSNALDTVDKVARRTFGLDSPGGGSPGSLLATVAPAVLCPVVDVDPVPAPLPPAEPVQ